MVDRGLPRFLANASVLKSVGIISIVLMGGGTLTACGGGASSEATSVAPAVLTKQILDIPQGTSLAGVEVRLGEPASRVATASETTLSYGAWRLIFESGHLARRIRSRGADQTGVPAISDRESKALDQKVLGIRRGTSIVSVRRNLGPPEHDEEIFEGVSHPLVILGYGAWELRFRDGELKGRTKF